MSIADNSEVVATLRRFTRWQPQQRKELGPYVFDSDFDSGNMGRVERVPLQTTSDLDREDPYEYVISVAPDCANTQYETKNQTWFYFSVSAAQASPGGLKKKSIRLSVQHMNNQNLIYQQGLRPFWRNVPHQPRWSRIPMQGSKFTFKSHHVDGRDCLRISWRHTFRWEDGTTYFAFCEPFSYTDCQELLSSLEQDFSTHARSDYDGFLRFPAPDTAAWIPRAGKDVYFHKQVLAQTLEGRNVDLVTVTEACSTATSASTCSGTGATVADVQAESLDEMPVGEGQPAALFPGRRIVFVSARVHPGETPGQFAFLGFLRFILSEDPRAVALRKLFVFKLVPMLNADGVARGHYRCNSQGLNLNRYYDAPVEAKHEAVWVVKQALMHWARQGRLLFYLDAHGHANKRGCFIFGNHVQGKAQAWNRVFARLCSTNSPHFDLDACDFDEKRMEATDKNGESFEGASRVAIHKDCGLHHSYTLECNYNTGRNLHKILPAANLPAHLENPCLAVAAASTEPVPYDMECWAQVGEGIAVSLLDMYGHNCWSRLPRSSAQCVYKLLHGDPASKRRPSTRTPRGSVKVAKEQEGNPDDVCSEAIPLLALPCYQALLARETPCGSSCCWVARDEVHDGRPATSRTPRKSHHQNAGGSYSARGEVQKTRCSVSARSEVLKTRGPYSARSGVEGVSSPYPARSEVEKARGPYSVLSKGETAEAAPILAQAAAGYAASVDADDDMPIAASTLAWVAEAESACAERRPSLPSAPPVRASASPRAVASIPCKVFDFDSRDMQDSRPSSAGSVGSICSARSAGLAGRLKRNLPSADKAVGKFLVTAKVKPPAAPRQRKSTHRGNTRAETTSPPRSCDTPVRPHLPDGRAGPGARVRKLASLAGRGRVSVS